MELTIINGIYYIEFVSYAGETNYTMGLTTTNAAYAAWYLRMNRKEA